MHSCICPSVLNQQEGNKFWCWGKQSWKLIENERSKSKKGNVGLKDGFTSRDHPGHNPKQTVTFALFLQKRLISMNYNIDFCEQMLIYPTWIIRLIWISWKDLLVAEWNSAYNFMNQNILLSELCALKKTFFLLPSALRLSTTKKKKNYKESNALWSNPHYRADNKEFFVIMNIFIICQIKCPNLEEITAGLLSSSIVLLLRGGS